MTHPAENGLPRECGPHRIPQGPNEDIGQCPVCWAPTFAMRPENEQMGLHADDCSLPRRHEGYCVGGGVGHPVPEVVRGYWLGMDEDVAAARAKFGSVLPPGHHPDCTGQHETIMGETACVFAPAKTEGDR